MQLSAMQACPERSRKLRRKMSKCHSTCNRGTRHTHVACGDGEQLVVGRECGGCGKPPSWGSLRPALANLSADLFRQSSGAHQGTN
ncbi:hypothetical protein MTP99_005024 [Tenebrio molitor]|nr:hypothetical protein MTP99_005024 [Tenebrio molitor]